MEEHIKHTRLPFRCGAGEANVNVRTGRMTFAHPDLEIGCGDFSIAIAHVFNPENPFAGIAPYMGNGWKLNVQQYIIPDEENDGSDSDKFTYIDETGLSHRFDCFHNSSRYYYADGYNSVLQVLDSRCRGSEGSRYVIIDETGNQRYFDPLGRLRSMVSAQNPNAVQVFEYADDKLTVIYDAGNPSKKITLEYEENLLRKVIYEEAEEDSVCLIRTLCYGYDASGNLTGIIRKTLNADKKTEAVETVVGFEYDLEKDMGTPNNPLYLLTKAVDGQNNSALQIDYSDETCEGVYRVQKVISGYCVVTASIDDSDPYGYGYGTNGDNTETASEVGHCPVFSIGAMSGSNIKEWTELTLNSIKGERFGEMDCVVTVENDKDIVQDYFFDSDGFTTDISER